MANLNVAAVRDSEIEPLLFSKKDTARVLSISVRTVSTLLATKQLPCRRIGRRTLIPASAVRAFARAGR
jgi:excisionase family DNA binding protein